MLQMHADEGPSNVQARVRLDLLQRHRMPEPMVGGRGKGATRLRLRHHVADFSLPHCFGLHNDGPVQMLTALGRQINSPGNENLLHPFIDGLPQFRAGITPHFMTGHLTGGTAHHQNLALAEFGCLTDLLGGGMGFFSDLL